MFSQNPIYEKIIAFQAMSALRAQEISFLWVGDWAM